MSHTTIQAQIAQGVCTLTLNRPEVRNAMSLAMVGELTEAALFSSDPDERQARIEAIAASKKS